MDPTRIQPPSDPRQAARPVAQPVRPKAAEDAAMQVASYVEEARSQDASQQALPAAYSLVQASLLSPAADRTSAYTAGARLAAGRAASTRLLGGLVREPARQAQQGGPGACQTADQGKAFAKESFSGLVSAVAEVNRTRAMMSSLNLTGVAARGGFGGEGAIKAMASAMRDANTRVDVAVRRLRDSYQVSGSVTVRMADGKLQVGGFSLSFMVGSEEVTMLSPAAAAAEDAPDDAEELDGSGSYQPPGSTLDLKV